MGPRAGRIPASVPNHRVIRSVRTRLPAASPGTNARAGSRAAGRPRASRVSVRRCISCGEGRATAGMARRRARVHDSGTVMRRAAVELQVDAAAVKSIASFDGRGCRRIAQDSPAGTHGPIMPLLPPLSIRDRPHTSGRCISLHSRSFCGSGCRRATNGLRWSPSDGRSSDGRSNRTSERYHPGPAVDP